MPKLVFSEAAKADINNIWNYTVKTWGRTQAERYNKLIQAACEALSEGTQSGQSVEYIRVGYRKLHVGRHTIYFRPYRTEIEVIRVLHQSMDVDYQL